MEPMELMERYGARALVKIGRKKCLVYLYPEGLTWITAMNLQDRYRLPEDREEIHTILRVAPELLCDRMGKFKFATTGRLQEGEHLYMISCKPYVTKVRVKGGKVSETLYPGQVDGDTVYGNALFIREVGPLERIRVRLGNIMRARKAETTEAEA